MKITVIGAGYVGLATATLFSELGNHVSCLDVSEERIQTLKNGRLPFFEPGMAEYIKRNNKDGRLNFTTEYKQAIPNSEVIFICVGTPPLTNGEADLTYLFKAIEETAKNLKNYALIVIKSTYPIGFEKKLEETVKKHFKGQFEFATSPEFLKEGTVIEDTFHPDRIIIGAQSEKAKKLLLDLHSPLPGERIVCDLRSAQLIKYASNSFLATKISFANSLANICEKVGADVEKVIEGVGADKRIGKAFMKPGVGYGGSCLPKDVLAFIHQASTFNYNFEILRSVNNVNVNQVDLFVNKIKTACDKKENENLQGISLAILGLAFKPNTDDMRDAPSIKIIRALIDLKAAITAYDPEAIESAKKIIPDINYANAINDAVLNKNALVIVTDWPEFKELDLANVKKKMKTPIIIDGRNIYNVNKMHDLGFKYFSIGR